MQERINEVIQEKLSELNNVCFKTGRSQGALDGNTPTRRHVICDASEQQTKRRLYTLGTPERKTLPTKD